MTLKPILVFLSFNFENGRHFCTSALCHNDPADPTLSYTVLRSSQPKPLMLQGALGRFINHSCEPNCETQKWLVHGELAIGLFAIKDVDANQELTFDYNFERYGDKVKLILCKGLAYFRDQMDVESLAWFRHLESWIASEYKFCSRRGKESECCC